MALTPSSQELPGCIYSPSSPSTKTDMQLLWVQQLAVLPIILEDRDMLDENMQGRGLPLESQTVEPSARIRVGERERSAQARTLPILLF